MCNFIDRRSLVHVAACFARPYTPFIAAEQLDGTAFALRVALSATAVLTTDRYQRYDRYEGWWYKLTGDFR